MNLLTQLLYVYATYTAISLILSKGRLFCPSFIFYLSMTIMLTLAEFFSATLGFEVCEKTFEVFVIAGALFMVGDRIAYITTRPYPYYENDEIQSGPFFISPKNVLYLNVFLLLSTFFAYYVLKINAGGNLDVYKDMLVYNPNSVRYRALVSQIYKVNTCLCYIVMYIFVYNKAIYNVPIKQMKSTGVTIMLFSLFSVFAMGARQPTIEAFLFMAFVYVALKVRKDEIKEVYKFAIKLLPSVWVLVTLFSVTATLVGRRAHDDIPALQYFTIYYSGGLYAFNLHVNEPCTSKIWGESSFGDVHVLLSKLGLSAYNVETSYHEFELYGNTVTIYGRWYEDFGATGVYIMIFLVAFLFGRYFYKYIISTNVYTNHMVRFFFCKFIMVLLFAGYDDRVRALFSTMTIALFIVTPFLFKRLVHKENIR